MGGTRFPVNLDTRHSLTLLCEARTASMLYYPFVKLSNVWLMEHRSNAVMDSIVTWDKTETTDPTSVL